ncbi:hypothetical protein LEP1GSC168_0957 [Leptospira santarosai str. HAI134]|nr:hypothetical protein LEP1GSC168_0957 [Leptospira santarosai str. HAI134]
MGKFLRPNSRWFKRARAHSYSAFKTLRNFKFESIKDNKDFFLQRFP